MMSASADVLVMAHLRVAFIDVMACVRTINRDTERTIVGKHSLLASRDGEDCAEGDTCLRPRKQ